MKGFLTIALLSLLMASTHVSSAQEESPGRKATIENQLSAPATIDFQFTPALAKKVLAFTGSPLIHSSGGLPFSWLS